MGDTQMYEPRGRISGSYRNYDTYLCRGCGAVVNDMALHDEFHHNLNNHGHGYAAAYGPGSQWDTTYGPAPAKQRAE
jgi:hypothetical protein